MKILFDGGLSGKYSIQSPLIRNIKNLSLVGDANSDIDSPETTD